VYTWQPKRLESLFSPRVDTGGRNLTVVYYTLHRMEECVYNRERGTHARTEVWAEIKSFLFELDAVNYIPYVRYLRLSAHPRLQSDSS
jgi:hypothetical protein